MRLYQYIEPTEQTTWSEISWAAGFFEGDGTVNNKGHAVSIAQAHLEPLFRLRNTFGGSIYKYPQDPRNPKGSMYSWYTSGEQAKAFIRCVFPLLSPRRQEQLQKATQ